MLKTDGTDRGTDRKGSRRRSGDYKGGMAAPVGATVGCYSHSPESSGIFPADTFGFGRSTSDGLRTDVDKVMARWAGHGLSWPPASGIDLGSDGRTRGNGLDRFDQYIPVDHPTSDGRKRRAGSQVTTDSDMRMDVMFEETQRGTLRKRALFGPGCCGWPAEDDFPEGARSPGVGLADVVARLQREVEDFRSESLHDCPGTTSAGPGLHQQEYLCLRARLVGIIIDKYSRPLSSPMDGMMRRWRYSCCPTSRGTP